MKNVYQALLACQKEFSGIPETKKNPFFNSDYAPLPEVLKTILPILNRHGLVVTHSHDSDLLVTRLVHAESGEMIESKSCLKGKPDMHGYAGATTYMRRHALLGLISAFSDHDDDGNTAVGGQVSTSSSPADYVFKTTKFKGKKISTIPKGELQSFLGWAKGQPKFRPNETTNAIEAFLKG